MGKCQRRQTSLFVDALILANLTTTPFPGLLSAILLYRLSIAPVKRRLIRTISSETSATKPLPQQYLQSKQHWLCTVRVENGAGIIDEYDIEPDRKLYLEDFLDIIADEIDKLDDPEGEDGDQASWKVDIFRLSR